MGEIIIKVCDDVKKIINTNLSSTEVLNKLGINKEKVEFWTEEELKRIGKLTISKSVAELDDEDYSKW